MELAVLLFFAMLIIVGIAADVWTTRSKTRMRRELLRVLVEAKAPMSSEEVAKRMKRNWSGSIYVALCELVDQKHATRETTQEAGTIYQVTDLGRKAYVDSEGSN